MGLYLYILSLITEKPHPKEERVLKLEEKFENFKNSI